MGMISVKGKVHIPIYRYVHIFLLSVLTGGNGEENSSVCE